MIECVINCSIVISAEYIFYFGALYRLLGGKNSRERYEKAQEARGSCAIA